MLARPVPVLAAFLHTHSQASLQMVLQKLRSIRCANDQHLVLFFLALRDKLDFCATLEFPKTIKNTKSHHAGNINVLRGGNLHLLL
jgi:hypothetical protein